MSFMPLTARREEVVMEKAAATPQVTAAKRFSM
jgi:hypothetical protein